MTKDVSCSAKNTFLGNPASDGNTFTVTDAVAACDSANPAAWPTKATHYKECCGDGITDSPFEECDDGGSNSDSVKDACRKTCVKAYCGDGVTDSGEDCDGQNYCKNDCTKDGHFVFLSSAGGKGKLGDWNDANGKAGLEAGDTICQKLATDAGLSGTYKAWLSTTKVDAKNRIEDTIYHSISVTGLATPVKIADNLADLIDGSIDSKIGRKDEKGDLAPDGDQTHTGTRDDGTAKGGNNPVYTCNDWTDATAQKTGIRGQNNQKDTQWTNDQSNVACSAVLNLYCFESDPICSDGVVNGNEECDDGNKDANDGCDASCKNEV